MRHGELLKITALTFRKTHVPFKISFGHSLKQRNESDNIVVACRTSSGLVGYGEGVPRDYVTGETADTALAFLKTADLSFLAQIDDDPRALRDILSDAYVQRVSNTLPFFNSAWCALETAVLDAFAKEHKLSLSALIETMFGLSSSGDLAVSPSYSGIVSQKSFPQTALSALKMKLYGFENVKMKVGKNLDSDFRKVHLVKKILGQKARLGIDANTSWGEEECEKAAALFPKNLLFVEQPAPRGKEADARLLKKRFPLMWDESLLTCNDAEKLSSDNLLDIANIRLSKCGGIIQSGKIVAFIESKKLRYQIGCQVGETAILSAAGRHFAQAFRNAVCLEGSYDRFLLAKNVVSDPPSFSRGGRGIALLSSGLSINIVPSLLDEITVSLESVNV